MIELLRNCSHGSEIATYLVTDTDGRRIRKTAWTPEGIATLRAETEGWAWYTAHRPGSPRSYCSSQEKPGCFVIEINWIEGTKGDFTKGLLPHSHIVDAALNHYLSVWKDAPTEQAPLHGDFSIDNLFLTPDGIVVIDWEHFAPRAAPWGFDALYLLFETLWFGIRNNRAPSPKEMALLAKQLSKLIHSGKLPSVFLQKPLSATVHFIRTHSALWGRQLIRYPDKLPVLHYSEKQIAMIDQWLLDYRGRL